jgi:hypothetical protein
MVKTLKQTISKVARDANGVRVQNAEGYVTEYSFPVEQDGRSISCRPAKYVKYFGGKEPGARTMMKWENDGYSKTVTGYKTEPDGYGPDGSPSWLLALGYI